LTVIGASLPNAGPSEQRADNHAVEFLGEWLAKRPLWVRLVLWVAVAAVVIRGALATGTSWLWLAAVAVLLFPFNRDGLRRAYRRAARLRAR